MGMKSVIKHAPEHLLKFVKHEPPKHEGIPADVWQRAKGIAFLHMYKGAAVFSIRAGKGIVMTRLADGKWSAPAAVQHAGPGFGAEIGFEVADIMILFETAEAINSFMTNSTSLFGVNAGACLGAFGSETESGSIKGENLILYSHNEGVFAGISAEYLGFDDCFESNTKFYGRPVNARDILSGAVPAPETADLQRLYETLAQCDEIVKAYPTRVIPDYSNHYAAHDPNATWSPPLAPNIKYARQPQQPAQPGATVYDPNARFKEGRSVAAKGAVIQPDGATAATAIPAGVAVSAAPTTIASPPPAVSTAAPQRQPTLLGPEQRVRSYPVVQPAIQPSPEIREIEPAPMLAPKIQPGDQYQTIVTPIGVARIPVADMKATVIPEDKAKTTYEIKPQPPVDDNERLTIVTPIGVAHPTLEQMQGKPAEEIEAAEQKPFVVALSKPRVHTPIPQMSVEEEYSDLERSAAERQLQQARFAGNIPAIEANLREQNDREIQSALFAGNIRSIEANLQEENRRKAEERAVVDSEELLIQAPASARAVTPELGSVAMPSKIGLMAPAAPVHVPLPDSTQPASYQYAAQKQASLAAIPPPSPFATKTEPPKILSPSPPVLPRVPGRQSMTDLKPETESFLHSVCQNSGTTLSPETQSFLASVEKEWERKQAAKSSQTSLNPQNMSNPPSLDLIH